MIGIVSWGTESTIALDSFVSWSDFGVRVDRYVRGPTFAASSVAHMFLFLFLDDYPAYFVVRWGPGCDVIGCRFKPQLEVQCVRR